MAKNENNFDLESIIKVEPEEFQTTHRDSDSRQSADDVLRSKSNIFSDPIVLLERHATDIKTSETSSLYQLKKIYIQSETSDALAKKGNDGVNCMDPHTCCFCQKVLTNRGTLRKHLKRVHCRTTKMSCDLCPKTYFSKGAIAQHMRLVHSKKRFACNVCDYKTADKSHLEKHKLTHGAKVSCPVCNKQVSSLKSHMRAHRPKVYCPICRKMIIKRCMREHMKTHGKKCKNCHEVFESLEELRRHNLKKHYDGELHECHCGSVYKSKKELKVHQQSHDEKITCEVCQKPFSSISNLRYHWKLKHLQTHGKLESNRMRALNNNGPFICDKCGSKHPTRTAFRKHMIWSHQSATIFCELCPRSFNQKAFLIDHMERVHLKLLAFECKICGQKSSTKPNLKIHMQRHGQKTECKVCHKLVTNVYAHLKTHVKVKCPICSKIYSKSFLTRHIKTKHKIRRENGL